ncbi:MAG: GyrI-like domain-containing protein [Candidatus Nanopelagicales bacterium]
MDYDISVTDLAAQDTAVVRGHAAMDGIPGFLGEAFGAVIAAVGGPRGVAGPPFARYDMADGGFAIEAGFPVGAPAAEGPDVVAASLPGGPAAVTMHVGAYDLLAEAYAALEAWLPAHGYRVAGAPWETYLDGPEAAEPRTVVTWPCRSA